MTDQIKTDFKAGDELTSSHLNAMGAQIVANAAEVAAAKQAAEEAKAAAEAASAEAGAKAEAEAAAAQAAQVAADLEANAQADAAIAEQVQTNVANIQANAEKAQQALDAIAANAEADSAVAALAQANKELIEANTANDELLAAKVGNIEQDYVSKADTKSGVKAQTLYNLVTHKVTATNGDVSQIFAESDGGGSMITSTANDFKAYVGCNNEKTLGVQIYVKNNSDNVGCRLNCGQQGFFYTKNKANGSYDTDDEITTKASVKALIAEFLQTEEGKDIIKQIMQENGVVLGS